jgi:hypothetical protein
MSDAVSIEFSYTGESKNRDLWAFMASSPDEVQRAALSLLIDLKTHSENAAVWINGKKFTPTKEAIREYNERVMTLLSAEKERRLQPEEEEEESQDVEPSIEEAQAMVDELDEGELPALPDIRF